MRKAKNSLPNCVTKSNDYSHFVKIAIFNQKSLVKDEAFSMKSPLARLMKQERKTLLFFIEQFLLLCYNPINKPGIAE